MLLALTKNYYDKEPTYNFSITLMLKMTLIKFSIYLSVALQSFVGPWPLFQFLNPKHSWLDSLDGGSARRKAATYTQNNTNTE
jgi:hypothetical protein